MHASAVSRRRLKHVALVTVVSPLLVTILACGKQSERPNTETAAQGSSLKRLKARCTHSVGLCNLPLFIAHADRETPAISQLGVDIELQSVPDWGKHAIALQKGDVDFSVTPFTTVMVAYAAGAPLRIIAGSGMNGLRLVAARDIDSPSKLRHKRIGTFRADTLEMMLFSYLAKNKIPYSDVEIVYFDDSFGLLSAYAARKVDALTHVEPYATRAMKERESVLLASGEGPEVWGINHPDCVLVTTAAFLDRPEGRETAKRLIKAMLLAKQTIDKDPDLAARRTAQVYFRGNTDDIVQAGKTQRPGIDIRSQIPFMSARFEDLKTLGYVPTDARFDKLLNLSILDEVIGPAQPATK